MAVPDARSEHVNLCYSLSPHTLNVWPVSLDFFFFNENWMWHLVAFYSDILNNSHFYLKKKKKINSTHGELETSVLDCYKEYA